MASTMTESQNNQGLRALDPDLPFLAAEVAIDVDNLLVRGVDDRKAMRRLAAKLLQSIDEGPSDVTLPPSRMDIATSTILGGAVRKAIGSKSSKNLGDLLVEARKIAVVLDSGDPKTEREELEQAGDFCVALSRAVAAHRESIRDLRPPHPFRR